MRLFSIFARLRRKIESSKHTRRPAKTNGCRGTTGRRAHSRREKERDKKINRETLISARLTSFKFALRPVISGTGVFCAHPFEFARTLTRCLSRCCRFFAPACHFPKKPSKTPVALRRRAYRYTLDCSPLEAGTSRVIGRIDAHQSGPRSRRRPSGRLRAMEKGGHRTERLTKKTASLMQREDGDPPYLTSRRICCRAR